jgi:hypothetical protein
MSVEFRSITLQNLQEAVDVLNESSKGTSVEQQLDSANFLVLAHHWNFSYEQSLVTYDDARPVAIIVNCTDRESSAAYTFYWGAIPSIRHSRIALRLFEASCAKLRDDGYTMLYGDSVPDRAAQRYRFIHAVSACNLLQMQTASVMLPPQETPFAMRQLDQADLAKIQLQPDENLHWTQRPHFARNAIGSIHLLGAYDDGGLQAYTTLWPQAAQTTILDLRSPTSNLPAGHALVRSLLALKYPLPFVATNVPENSYSQQVFSDADFRIEKRYSFLRRQLSPST